MQRPVASQHHLLPLLLRLVLTDTATHNCTFIRPGNCRCCGWQQQQKIRATEDLGQGCPDKLMAAGHEPA
jgi:hypothetical protein